MAGGRLPTARGAHEALATALADQASWAARAGSAKELLAAMLTSRRAAANLAKQHDTRCALLMADTGLRAALLLLLQVMRCWIECFV